MTDSIKFGPEWLRNLSGDSCNSGGVGGGGGGGGTANLITPRYQLAEHRYGREEMLGIFDRSCKPPETLISLQTLYVEKTQLPLAMIPMTEDENRSWNIGVGSSATRGRGGSVDRGGRGRTGRGGSYPSHYSRGVGFDDSGEGSRLESQPYTSRNRGFDRSQSERSWTDRNGVTDQGDWNGMSTSPRKEVSRGTSGSSLMDSNWRRQRGGIGGGGGGGGGSNNNSALDDEEGWRANRSASEKWSRGSWRDASGNERDRLDRSDGDIDENRPPGRWDRSTHRQSHDPAIHHHSSSTGPPRTSRTWDSNHHDNLPEWATENPSESGGSFDASGAFHGGMFSDEDDESGGRGNTSNEMRPRRVSEGNNNGNHKIGKVIYQSPVGNNRHQNLSTTPTTKERPKSLHPFDDKEPSIITSPDRPSISPTKQITKQQITSTNNNNSIKDNNNTRSTVQNSNEPPKIQGPQRSKSFIDPPTKTLKQNNDVRSKQNDQSSTTPSSTKTSSSLSNQKAQILQSKNIQNIKIDNVKTVQEIEQKHNDDDDERMKEEANMLVAKLMADEENHKEERLMHAPPVVNPVPPTPIVNSNVQEKWFYRDPQGELQGPFLANEMAEWCKAGYFTSSLQLRRECDDRFSTLGDLVKIFGRVPFTPGPTIPPLKIVETIIPTIPIPIPNPTTTTTNISNNALPKPPQIDDPIALFQYSQLRLYHDQMIMQQVKSAAIAKLSQHEQWNNLNQADKNHLIMQSVMQNPEIREMTANTNQYVPIIPHQPQQQQQQPLPLPTNPIMQLFNQIQSGKASNDNHLSQNTVPHIAPIHPVGNSIDPIQQLMQQMQQRGIPNIPGPSQPNVIPQPQPQSQLQQNDDPIKSLLRQLHGDAAINGHQQIDSIWPHPPQQINPQFDSSSLLAQMRPLPSAAPPGQMPNMLWDLHTKGMKTEQQILEEQQQQQQHLRQQQENRTKEEQRKQEELLRKAKDESLKRQNEEEQKQQLQQQQHVRQLEELKRKEEQKKLKEEEKLRKEEEKRRIEEKIRKDEERKREEKRKIDEDNNRKKQEEEKKRRDELKRQEEKQKKEEDKKRKLEEEQKKIEDERLKKEEENRKKIEQEENARKAEQRRREADALKKLQEKSKAPWAPQATSVVTQSAASLTEIQRLEREMKAEEQRYQLMLKQQLNQQKAQAAKEAAAALVDSSKKLQFKWAAKLSSNTKPQVKSLDQIQQEEQERIAKSKQQEKEKAEKSNIKENTVVMQSVGIWGAASQSLNWTSSSSTTTTTILSSSSSSSLSSNTVDSTKNTNINKGAWAGSGFWDEPTPNKIANSTIKQTPVKTQVVAKSSNSTLQNQNLHNNSNNNSNNNNNNNNKIVKTKTKKDDEVVKKIYDNNTNSKDEFGQWCYRTLCGLQSTVDIPTFVGFLKEIESAYEVKEYVKMYLGESKQTTEFVKQFLEKRSKLRSAQRPQAEADDLCKPAPAVNPNAPTEFQEVKGKSKKPKKGKMFKVDNTILGFSVTASTDRINVGDRDYGEGV